MCGIATDKLLPYEKQQLMIIRLSNEINNAILTHKSNAKIKQLLSKLKDAVDKYVEIIYSEILGVEKQISYFKVI